jgi:hypothetical protein
MSEDIATELKQAQRGMEEILERIKDGDPEGTPEALEDAERRVRLAWARVGGDVEGDKHRLAEEAERDCLQRLEELRERAIKDLDLEPLHKAREKLERALDGFVEESLKYNARLANIIYELPTLASLPEGWFIDATSAGLTMQMGLDTKPGKFVRPMVEVRDLGQEVIHRKLGCEYIPPDHFEGLDYDA